MSGSFVLQLSSWALLFATIMPIVVALVTKAAAHPGVKAIALFFLDVLNAVLTDWFATPNLDWEGVIVNALMGFIVSVGAYFGLLKPTQITGRVQAATANVGIG